MFMSRVLYELIAGNNLKRPMSYFEAIWITKKENEKEY